MGKQRKKWVSNVQLSDDIIVEILSRLPVKALLQFRCVCKLWKCLISKPNFILSTVRRERATLACDILGRARSGKWERIPLYWCDDELSTSGEIEPISFYSMDDEVSSVKLPNPVGEVPPRYASFHFFGTCNGLILFCADGRMYLWNPTTRCCKVMTQPNGLVKRFESGYYPEVASGLCFDKSSNDYKVVLVFVDYIHPQRNYSVYVASFREGENRMDISFPYKLPSYNDCIATSTSGVLVCEHLHWIVKEKVGDSQLIVYFDEEMNQFRELPMPQETKSDDEVSACYYFGLTVLNGCLSMSRVVSVHKDVRKVINDV